MTIEELDTLTKLFKETFPYYDKNEDITIDDDVIRVAFQEAELHKNKKCKTKRDEILIYLAMHIILKKIIEEEQFINGEFELLDKVDSYSVGDIDVTLAGGAKSGDIPTWWGTTKYGVRAWELSLNCAKSRVGLIV